jgi:hypothetical protein
MKDRREYQLAMQRFFAKGPFNLSGESGALPEA